MGYSNVRFFPLLPLEQKDKDWRVAKSVQSIFIIMGKLIIQDNGKIRKYEDVEFAEKIVEDRKKKDPWIIIDKLIKVWAEKSPDDVEAVMVNVEQYKESQVDKKYAQTMHGQDQERRFTMAFPRNLMLMIRTQYKAEELPFDRDFFREFVKRYPAFKVADKM